MVQLLTTLTEMSIPFELKSSTSDNSTTEQYWPVPWIGPKGQGKCGACGRFLKKNGMCSLVQMTYRSGSAYGYEHR